MGDLMGDVGFTRNISTTSGGFHKWAPKWMMKKTVTWGDLRFPIYRNHCRHHVEGGFLEGNGPLPWTSNLGELPEDMWRDIAGLRAENNDLKDDLGDAKKALRQAEETSRNALERAEVAEEKVKSSGQDEVKQLREDRKITDFFGDFPMKVRGYKGFNILGQLVVKMVVNSRKIDIWIWRGDNPWRNWKKGKRRRCNWNRMLQSYNISTRNLRLFALPCSGQKILRRKRWSRGRRNLPGSMRRSCACGKRVKSLLVETCFMGIQPIQRWHPQ